VRGTEAPGGSETAMDRSMEYQQYQYVDRGSGWVTFASVILMFAGVMRFFDAIWAFRYDGTVPEGLQDALFGDDLTTYGWVYLLVAIVLVAAGFGVARGGQFSRWIGVGAAVIGGLSAVPWLPYYPIWSLVYITIAFLTMYALLAYGGRESTSV
jgi:hypothetical protein